MNLQELEARLRAAGYPESSYVTDGSLGAGECVGIEPTPGGWSVYYSERGRKSPLESFPDEDRACHRMLQLMQRLMRRGWPRAAAGLPDTPPRRQA